MYMSKDRLSLTSGITMYVEELANILTTIIYLVNLEITFPGVLGVWGGPVTISGRESL